MDNKYIHFDYLNYSNHKIFVNNKEINIINIGEIHTTTPKLDITFFKNKKTCFYVEIPHYIFKTSNYSKNMFFYMPEFHNNFRIFFEEFAYYFKINNYNFENEFDLDNIMNNCKEYDNNWKLCPCDYRYIKTFPKYHEPILLLLKYYLYNKNLLHDIFKNKNYYNTMINNLFIHVKNI